MSSRDGLLTYLATVIAETPELSKIKLIKSVRATDQLDARSPILIVKTDRFEHVGAAAHWVQGFFTLGLVSNHVNPDKAEAQLDDLLEFLLPKLMGSKVMWETATQTAYDEQHTSYDIAVRAIP